MADPTNRNDPTFANDPNYVYVGGRWQNRNNGTGTNSNTPAAGGKVTGSSVEDPNGIFGANGIFGDPDHLAQLAAQRAGIGPEIPNFAGYQAISQQFRDGAMRQQATNPYNAGIADQSRPAQLTLMDQMRAQMNGPSIAGMQGQRAFGASGQQALMQGGRAGMLGAQNAGAGIAGDLGQARLAEIMRSQAGIGGAAGSLRGADLRSADAQMGAGFQAQNINDQMARFYASQGSRLDEARARAELDNRRLVQQKGLDIAKSQMNLGTSLLGAGATIAGTAASQGGKK